jgi:hypothetical protein
MGSIYANACLTIRASAAKDGSEGLPNRRKIRKLELSTNVLDYTLCVHNAVHHELWGGYFMSQASRNTEHTLPERAWCLQEELLSPCFVHFTPYEIHYVCQEATICECRPSWYERFTVSRTTSPPKEGQMNNELALWTKIIEHYSRRQISLHQDRLPAISSLTRFMGERAGRYLAGSWEAQLPNCLLWVLPEGHRPDLPSYTGSCPPSWSWASTKDGVIIHPKHSQTEENSPSTGL